MGGIVFRFALAVMLVATVPVKAAPFEVECITPKEPVYLGQVFPVYVVIEGLDSVASKGRVEFPGSDKLEVRLVGDWGKEA